MQKTFNVIIGNDGFGVVKTICTIQPKRTRNAKI